MKTRNTGSRRPAGRGAAAAGAFFIALALMAAAIPSSSAQQTKYLSLEKDSGFCMYETFGDDGDGEYTLTIEDPGHPGNPWVDIHRASFSARSDRTVIIPVCISTKGRWTGESAVITVNLEAPDVNKTSAYGICVSDYEGTVSLDSALDYDPCEVPEREDFFSADLFESTKTAKPGEKVTYTLLVSSYSFANIVLDKVEGPRMQIEATRLYMPGDKMVDIEMDAPSEPGDYGFTISAKAESCEGMFCEKLATGTLKVLEPNVPKSGFRIEITPKNKNVEGLTTATYYLTITNDDDSQDFSVDIETDENIKTSIESRTVRVGKGSTVTVTFTAIPLTESGKLHAIKVWVTDSAGTKRVEQATLKSGIAQKPPQPQPPTNNTTLNNGTPVPWIQKNETPGPEPEPEPDATPLLIMAVILAAAVAIAAVYMYRKSKVINEVESSYFGKS